MNFEVAAKKKVIRAKFPDAVIVLAADNDRWSITPINNPGVHHARKAAHAVGGLVAVPDFHDISNDLDTAGKRKDKPTDYNDMHQRPGYGLDVVAASINAVLYQQADPDSAPEADEPLPREGETQFPAEASEVPRVSRSRTQDDAADGRGRG